MAGRFFLMCRENLDILFYIRHLNGQMLPEAVNFHGGTARFDPCNIDELVETVKIVEVTEESKRVYF